MTTKEKFRKYCEYFGLRYLGFWDSQHWAQEDAVKYLPHHGGMSFSINPEKEQLEQIINSY